MTHTPKHIAAIETEWRGYRFRSRLEARWAVFFEAMGYDWRYEVQGYRAACGTQYLPDFEIHHPYSEYPTYVEVKGNLQSTDIAKLKAICDYDSPLPGMRQSRTGGTSGLVLLGDIPRSSAYSIIVHPIVRHDKGLHMDFLLFVRGRPLIVSGDCYASHLLNLRPVVSIEADDSKWDTNYREIGTVRGTHYPFIDDAYAQARGARFEHGERP